MEDTIAIKDEAVETRSDRAIYQYEILLPGHIRLVRLHTKSDFSRAKSYVNETSIELRHFSTTGFTHPDFRFGAVSYTWGSPVRSRFLPTITGSCIPISVSLFHILDALVTMSFDFDGLWF